VGWVNRKVSEKDGTIRYTAMYRDIKGEARSAGTHATEPLAVKAWHKAEVQQASGRIGDPRRGRQKFKRYVKEEWWPNHEMELSTRENYHSYLKNHILPTFGEMRMVEILPNDVREWVTDLKQRKIGAPTIAKSKVVLDAILTTAFNDLITFLHAGKGVTTPTVVKKTKHVITAEQFDLIYQELPNDLMRLLVETDIETGLRWGELTELRPKDFNFKTCMLTVKRAVVELDPAFHPEGKRFYVKEYPKDGEWREFKVARHLVEKVAAHVAENNIDRNDLIFEFQQPIEPRRYKRPEELPDPITLGWTEPHPTSGRQYRHGTISAYSGVKCRCQFCRDAMASYRADRRAMGKDQPRKRRTYNTDGHIGGDWFRKQVWNKALAKIDLGFKITPHGLRGAHASWLLAGGANLQVVKERLGHGSIVTTEQYLNTLPGADDEAMSALDAIRGNRNPQPETESEPAAVEQPTPDLAEMMKMMAVIQDGVAKLASEKVAA
jgi:integrase